MAIEVSGTTNGVRWRSRIDSDGAKTEVDHPTGRKTFETRVRNGRTYANDGAGNWYRFDGDKYVPSGEP
jgi:hypothetical protein